MSNVVQIKRSAASAEVVEKLIRLGYLKRSKRREDSAIEDSLAQLQQDLCRDQTISTSDPPKSA
jgi:hypothetical protein